jgi:hypothetical protein
MFKKAEKKNVWLKLAVTGTSGSGKTTGALRLARGLLDSIYGKDKERIAFIDTENRSASLYADVYDFDVIDLEPPFEDSEKFMVAINEAIKCGYKMLIIDSATHIWQGILDYKSKLDERGNSYTNWKEAGNRFQKVIDAILQGDIHVICCMRSKMEYVIEKNDKGKQAPIKVGLSPIMRDGIEYEFSAVFDLDLSHNAIASKDRTRLFDGKIFQLSEEIGEKLGAWSGKPTPLTFNDEQIKKAIDFYGEDAVAIACEKLGFANVKDVPVAKKNEFFAECDKAKKGL